MSQQQSETKIWTYLKLKGLTDAGAAGCMGNFNAESGLRFDAIEKAKLNKTGLTSRQYIDTVDNGTRTRNVFINDRIGVSLYQATASNLKADLYDLAKSRGVSICDPDTVLDSFISALENYLPAVLKTLRSTNDVREASNAVLLKFERPADQSLSAQNRRYQYSLEFYNRYRGTDTAAEPDPPAPPPVDENTMTYEEFCAYMDRWMEEVRNLDTSAWAEPDVKWAVSRGLMKGDENGKLAPAGLVTREQMAALLKRFAAGV